MRTSCSACLRPSSMRFSERRSRAHSKRRGEGDGDRRAGHPLHARDRRPSTSSPGRARSSTHTRWSSEQDHRLRPRCCPCPHQTRAELGRRQGMHRPRLFSDLLRCALVRDEIRLIGPGLYLGKVYWKLEATDRFLARLPECRREGAMTRSAAQGRAAFGERE